MNITTATIVATSSGSHPPWVTFVRFADTNTTSSGAKSKATSAMRQRGHFHFVSASTRNITVVMMNMLVTATP